jgi:hypothetical protein
MPTRDSKREGPRMIKEAFTATLQKSAERVDGVT